MNPVKQIPQGQTSPTPFLNQRSGPPKVEPQSRIDAKVKEVCQTWALRTDLTIYTNGETQLGYDSVIRHSQALLPFASIPRTAYRKLLAEMQRREMAT